MEKINYIVPLIKQMGLSYRSTYQGIPDMLYNKTASHVFAHWHSFPPEYILLRPKVTVHTKGYFGVAKYQPFAALRYGRVLRDPTGFSRPIHSIVFHELWKEKSNESN